MNATWIVTANAGHARFFAAPAPTEDLQEIEDMVNDAARLRTAESETDRMGPTSAAQSIHNTGGALPNKTYEPAQTPAQRATEMFAKDVAQYLLKGHQEGRYREIALVASPQFLGILRQQLDPQLKNLVSVEINKDYTGLSAAQLREYVRAEKMKK
jgi:protein required for attachment to host cells